MKVYRDNRKRCSGFASGSTLINHIQTGWLRAVLFSLMWWVLADGSVDSWLVGAPSVLFATLVSLALLPPFPFSLTGIVRFVSFFLWRSLYGGVDVARRALHPHMPISPGLVDYRWRLPPGLPRIFMTNVVSLQPGTLSVELGADCLRVHVLDARKDFLPELKAVEDRVAEVFSISLPPGNGKQDGD